MVKRTKSGLPRYCSYNTDRHGKQRVRFRKDGFSTYLTATPWSEDFMRQYGLTNGLDGAFLFHNSGINIRIGGEGEKLA